VIVLKKATAGLASSVLSTLEKYSREQSTADRRFFVNGIEGPIYFAQPANSLNIPIHVLIGDNESISRWPSHIRRSRYYLHDDLYGEFKKHILRSGIDISCKEYAGCDFGIQGLRSAVANGTMAYKRWTKVRREHFQYCFSKSNQSAAYIYAYCILNSTINALDMSYPYFYEKWDKRYESLVKCCRNIAEELSERKLFDLALQVKTGLGKAYYQDQIAINHFKHMTIDYLDKVSEVYDPAVLYDYHLPYSWDAKKYFFSIEKSL
jgi:hypothetical protein